MHAIHSKGLQSKHNQADKRMAYIVKRSQSSRSHAEEQVTCTFGVQSLMMIIVDHHGADAITIFDAHIRQKTNKVFSAARI